jgi:hypothetical protein
VADGRLPLPGAADSDVAHLAVGGKLAEQHEVANGVAHWLLMQGRLEDPRIEPRRGGRVGHDDVEVLQAEVVERKRRAGRAPRRPAGG